VIRLGTAIAPLATAAADTSIITPQVSAVVRYNITPVDGLFETGAITYVLEVTSRGAVSTRVVQFELSTGTETDVVGPFEVSASPASGFSTASHLGMLPDAALMDFVNCAYYVEATLTASAIEVGNPAEIAAIKVYADNTR
jgi:hypothetical protein